MHLEYRLASTRLIYAGKNCSTVDATVRDKDAKVVIPFRISYRNLDPINSKDCVESILEKLQFVRTCKEIRL